MSTAQLARAVKAHRAAQASLDLARSNLHATITDELRNGTTQAELVKTTGYSREQLRRIARDAGIPAR